MIRFNMYVTMLEELRDFISAHGEAQVLGYARVGLAALLAARLHNVTADSEDVPVDEAVDDVVDENVTDGDVVASKDTPNITDTAAGNRNNLKPITPTVLRAPNTTSTITHAITPPRTGIPSAAVEITKYTPTIASAHLGKIAEINVFNILAARFPDVQLRTGEDKSADIQLWVASRKVTVEVKNYTRNVAQTEQDKFIRDLAMTNAHSGLFIAMGGIANISDDWHLTYEGTPAVPCIYLSNATAGMIRAAVTALAKIMDTADYMEARITDERRTMKAFLSVDGALENLTKVRWGLAADANKTSTALISNCSSIAVIEASLREVRDTARESVELAPGISTPIVPRILADNARWLSYTADRKQLMSSIMDCIEIGLVKKPGTWCISGTRCINKDTGIYIGLLIKKIMVWVPRSRVSAATQVHVLNEYPDAIIDDGISVEITERNMYIIECMIKMMPPDIAKTTEIRSTAKTTTVLAKISNTQVQSRVSALKLIAQKQK